MRRWMSVFAVLLLSVFSFQPSAFGQQPDRFRPSAGGGLVLNIDSGVSICQSVLTPYPAGTLTLTASATNYVYVDGSTCLPTFNTTGFPNTAQAVALATTNATAIVFLSDVRTYFETALKRFNRWAQTLSPAAVAANTCAEQAFTPPTTVVLNTSDVVYANKPTNQAGLSVTNSRVISSTSVGVNFCNNTAAAITPTASESYSFAAIQ